MDYRMMELLISICEIFGVHPSEVFMIKKLTPRVNKELTLRKDKVIKVIDIFTYWSMARYKIDSFKVAEFLEFKHRNRIYPYYQRGLNYSALQNERR